MAAPVVVPVDVFEGGELDVAESLPRPAWVDQLPFVEAVERFDHGVVVAVAAGPDRGDDVVVVEPLGVPDRQVLGGFNRLLQQWLVEASVDGC